MVTFIAALAFVPTVPQDLPFGQQKELKPLIIWEKRFPPPPIAKFFGVNASGNRFVFICDRSAVMNAKRLKGKGTWFEFLQKELAASLRGIEGKARFHVVFYDGNVTDMPGKTWRGTTKKDTDDVIKWIKSLKPRGKGSPAQAFQLAFKLKPRPDAIFFVAGDVVPQPQKFYAQIMTLIRGAGKKFVRINAIQLRTPAAPTIQRQLLQAIAGGTRGDFRLIP